MADDGTELSRAEFLRLAAFAGAALVAGAAPAVASSPTMTRRLIPRSGETLPAVGVGTWRTFDVGGDAGARARLAEVLSLFFAAGGSVIDSSPMYGSAEEVVGDLLAGMQARAKAFLATKVWIEGRQAGVEQMRASLRKLKVGTIDLMQVHNLVDWETHLKTLKAWKAEGRVRYVGVTHYATAALEPLVRVVEREPIDFVQMAYSLEVTDAEKRLLPAAQARGVAVIVNRPFEEGVMFDKAKGKELPPWAADFDCRSWAQFFLKFILGHPAVTCVIPGTGKPEHMRDNAAAGMGRLPDAGERRRMLEFWRSL
jgi:diketogulonate reductase-like aldo/keto reductase